MALTYDIMRRVTSDLYAWSLRRVPADALAAIERAEAAETHDVARRTLGIMLRSARAAEASDRFVCSDSGIPVYFIRIGTGLRIDGDIKAAIADGFAALCATSNPPLLKHVANPLTNERGHAGKDMPIVTWDFIGGADHAEITCQPKALGGGRWAALEIFVAPSLAQIEAYVMDCVLKAGSQACPPVTIGVGIGGTFDHAAKLAKLATLRPIGSVNPEPILADMETRLLTAVNKTGFGPMGTGGDTTAISVHIDYAAGHGFTPVAVCFNCWISRRTKAIIHADGRVERIE